MRRLARLTRLTPLTAGASALLTALALTARAQVPADSARRDSVARGDSAHARVAPSDSLPVVRHLTELGATVRPGTVLYHVRVVAPRPTQPSPAPRPDSLGAAPPAATPDSAKASGPPLPGPPLPGVPPNPAVPTPVALPAAPPGGSGNTGAAVAAAGPAGTPEAVAIDTTDLGTRTSSISATTYGGAPAWLVVSAGGRGARAAIDSLVLAQSDLRPLHLGGTIGLTRVSAEMPGDSVFAALSDPTGRHSVVAPVPHDAILSLETLDALLQVLPLAAGWTDSVHVAVIAPPTVTVDPAVLLVTGEESASTPLGPTPCWVVVLRSPTAEARLWVTKDTRTVVRVEQALPSPAGAVLQRVYVGGTTP